MLAILLSVFTGATVTLARAQTNAPVPVLQIKADQVTAKVSPMLYGLMTEEINYSYEGGLYGELIRNRSFKANATNAVFWKTVGGARHFARPGHAVERRAEHQLETGCDAGGERCAGGNCQWRLLGNSGQAEDDISGLIFCKAADGFNGPLTVSLESADGKKVFASAEVPVLSGDVDKI